MSDIPEEVKKYMSSLGKKGGKATGKSKNRGTEHYKKMVEIREQNRKKKKPDPDTK